jgi:hypothetical protein
MDPTTQMKIQTKKNNSAAAFALAAVYAGCPQDQIENFLSRGYVPFEKQLLLHAAARVADIEDGPDEIGYGGARGPGKSTAVFAQLALDDSQRRTGLKSLYLRKIGKQAREQLDDMRLKLLSFTTHDYNRSSGLISFPNGSRILTGHFKAEQDIDNYLGLEYDVIAVEEATTLTRTKKQALRDSNRTSRRDWRPRMYYTTNPGGVGHGWFKRRFVVPWERGREKYTIFIPGTLDDNPFLDAGYRRRVEENTGWRLRAYRYGDWNIAAGQFFTTWNEAIHVIESESGFKPLQEWVFWCAMDYGVTHYNVVHLLAMDNDRNVYVLDEQAARRQLVPQNADQIKDMLARNGLGIGDLSVFLAGQDVFAKRHEHRGRYESIADKYGREGIVLEPANMDRISGAAKIMDMLGDESAGIGARLFVHERCARLVDQIPSMQHDPSRPEDVLKEDVDEDGDGGDDAYDAVRYGIMWDNIPGTSVGRNPLAGYRG